MSWLVVYIQVGKALWVSSLQVRLVIGVAVFRNSVYQFNTTRLAIMGTVYYAIWMIKQWDWSMDGVGKEKKRFTRNEQLYSRIIIMLHVVDYWFCILKLVSKVRILCEECIGIVAQFATDKFRKYGWSCVSRFKIYFVCVKLHHVIFCLYKVTKLLWILRHCIVLSMYIL